jgi:YD repeat-containing protein
MNIPTISNRYKLAAILSLVLSIASSRFVTHAQTSSVTSASDRLAHTAFLGEHFSWIGTGTAPEGESEALLTALMSATTNQWPYSLSAFEDFLAANPQSGWVSSVRSELADAYFKSGRYTLALQNWENVWQATKGYTDGPGKKVADFTLAHWTRLLASLGRIETLVPLFDENKNRALDSFVLTKWLRTREAVATMGKDPAIAYQCGTLALFNAASVLNLRAQAHPLLEVPSPVTGFSIKALSDLSTQYGLGFVPVKRESGTALVVPSVVHWSQNHYAAITRSDGHLYLVVDPTFGMTRTIDPETLNAEASGFFLVPSGQLPPGYRLLTSEEAGTVFGRGFSEQLNDGDDQPYCFAGNGGNPGVPGQDGPEGQDGSLTSAGGYSCGSCGSGSPAFGMPRWRVSEPYINLWLEDEPLGYQPALGPRVSFQVRYKQRAENVITDIVGLGPNCACSWLSAINVEAYFTYHTFVNEPFTISYGQGGIENYYNLPALATNYYNSLKMQVLTNGSGYITNFQMLYPDGSIDYYGMYPTNNGGNPSNYYLSQKVSPEGYITTFQYDISDPSNIKLIYVIDPNNGTNSLYYVTNTTMTILISQVTDPYGRSTYLYYDSNDHLTNLVDVVGISSKIIYDTTAGSGTYGWVTNLTTPYGASSFVPYDAGYSVTINRSITITQPDGGNQFYVFFLSSPPYEPNSYSGSQVSTNDPLNTLDTAPTECFSYHWGPRQYSLLSTNNDAYFTSVDYLRARMRHWLGTTPHGTVRSVDTLSIQREPSADGVNAGQLTWYDYTGKLTANYDQGYHILPDYIGRVLPDTFDSYDHPTNIVDANGISVAAAYDNLGRTLTRTYPDTGSEQFGYSAAGLTAYTNQLHFTNFFTYDPAGRKTWETNANAEQTHFQYDAAADLTNLVDGAGHTTSWKFDVYGRITNKVDNAGNNLFFYGYDPDNRLTNRNSVAKGTTTYRYDPVGNLTNVVYPVNTALVMSYDVLNRLTNLVDGIGTTRYAYDAAGQLLSEGGLWTDDAVSYTYNNRLRTGLGLLQPDSSAWAQSYSYDGARRLTSLSSPAGTFSYSYDPTRHLQVNKLTEPNGAYITNTFDSVARLLSTTLKNSGSTVLNSHNYVYNVGNQRTALTNVAGDYRLYAYDKIGQLKTALGSESGGTSRLLEQLSYAYDSADNLNYRTNNALVDTFNVNTLNELGTITHSGTLTVAGTTTTNATSVTVNNVIASRYNDATFALGGFPIPSGSTNYTAGAQDALGRTSTNSVTVNLPATVTFAYDSNGNLLNDGTRYFSYDDENQLLSVTVSNSWRSEFVYDGKMRRRQRVEYYLEWQHLANQHGSSLRLRRQCGDSGAKRQ